jgi:hypothetical protein
MPNSIHWMDDAPRSKASSSRPEQELPIKPFGLDMKSASPLRPPVAPSRSSWDGTNAVKAAPASPPRRRWR